MKKIKQCEICEQYFEPEEKGYTRRYCYECSPKITENFSHAQNISVKRRAIKKYLIKYMGGKCQKCGYDKSMRALEFHHLDPTQKDFGISKHINRNLEQLKEEVSKCIILCSNCHAEEHDRLYLEGYNQFNPDI